MAGTKGRRGHTPQYRRPRDIFGTVRWPKGGGGERGCQWWAMSEGLQSPVSHSFSTVPPHGGFQVAGGRGPARRREGRGRSRSSLALHRGTAPVVPGEREV